MEWIVIFKAKLCNGTDFREILWDGMDWNREKRDGT